MAPPAKRARREISVHCPSHFVFLRQCSFLQTSLNSNFFETFVAAVPNLLKKWAYEGGQTEWNRLKNNHSAVKFRMDEAAAKVGAKTS